MKLAALYSVYNGLELLEGSIEQIREFVDLIVISYQTTSNKGNYSAEVEPFIDRFIDQPGVEVIEFVPDLKLSTKQNERNKLQQRIDFAKSKGCTHYFGSATDHYYRKEEFEFAKTFLQLHEFDVTFTRMFTYYKDPTWQIYPIEDYWMPFISKIYPNTRVVTSYAYPVRTDPSVQIHPCRSHYKFDPNEIMMHHYSMIRSDIQHKFDNAAASIRWTPDQVKRMRKEFEEYDLETNPGITYFKKRKVRVVPNYFGISL